jgi:hypothetical protein
MQSSNRRPDARGSCADPHPAQIGLWHTEMYQTLDSSLKRFLAEYAEARSTAEQAALKESFRQLLKLRAKELISEHSAAALGGAVSADPPPSSFPSCLPSSSRTVQSRRQLNSLALHAVAESFDSCFDDGDHSKLGEVHCLLLTAGLLDPKDSESPGWREGESSSPLTSMFLKQAFTSFTPHSPAAAASRAGSGRREALVRKSPATNASQALCRLSPKDHVHPSPELTRVAASVAMRHSESGLMFVLES